MKKMFNFRSLAILCLAIGLVVSLTRCKKYDDDVNRLQTQISALKADVAKDFKEKVDGQMGTLDASLKSAVARLDALEKQSASGANVQSQIDAVKKELMDNLVSKETYNQFVEATNAKIAAATNKDQLDAVNTKINSIEGRVAALEALKSVQEGTAKAFNDFKAEYAKVYGMLKGDIDALSQKISTNTTALNNLKSDLATKANKSDFDALKSKVDSFLSQKLDVSVAALTGRLSGLILIPDYVADQGGALPLLNFSPIRTKECGDLVPAVLVRYRVNPSNADLDQIKKEGLTFLYNDPMVAAKSNNAGVDQKAEFVSLENGVLTVKASLNTAKLWASKQNPENRIDELMLQVPLKDGNVVSSDWAKVTFKPEEVAIVKKPKKQVADKWEPYMLKDYVNIGGKEAKTKDESVKEGVVVGNSAKDYTVVDMVYDQDLDLREYVKAMFGFVGSSDLKGDLDTQRYGLHFEFDLNNGVTGKPIVYNLGGNKTNQQEFIKLSSDGYTVSTRVYSVGGNKAAIGRTPIVHVMLKTKDGCVAREGYLKLNIVDKILPPVPPVVYKKAVAAGCGDHEANRIGTQQMNEDFYHKVNMSKEAFHGNYKFEQVAKTNDPNNVGTITQVPDPGDKQSYNLVYKLTEDEVWSHIGKTVWAEATYTYGASVIKVRFEAPITKETVKLNLAISNYWYDGYKYTRQNVAVPLDGSVDPTKCTWKNNISSAFTTITKDNKDYGVNSNDNRTQLLDLPSQGYKDYSYEYIFDDNQPIKTVDGITISVSADKKQLLATKGSQKEVVATILPQKAGVNEGEGDPLQYNKNSELGKYLLNKTKEFMKARVVLVVRNACDRRVNVEVKNLPEKDRFIINFLRPVNVDPQSAKNFVDGVDFGAEGSYIDVKKVAQLSDWRNYVKNTHDYDFLPNNANYYKYYGVKNITMDVDKITVEGLQVDGKDLTKLPNTIIVKQTPNNDTFKGKSYDFGRLTYKNNGINLDKPFTMTVPVTVEYKWGMVKDTVKVVVQPTKTK